MEKCLPIASSRRHIIPEMFGIPCFEVSINFAESHFASKVESDNVCQHCPITVVGLRSLTFRGGGQSVLCIEVDRFLIIQMTLWRGGSISD